ncbi:MAG TPA: PEP-CTERM sorting domain-containing protein [Pirellulales bacterium]|nr:PEP-CTERM sorting domain-containing protein [Pirellulales bacterium]
MILKSVNRKWTFPTLGFLVVLASAQLASAAPVPISFTIDTTGGATGLTPISNASGNVGKYASGSWLTLGGSVSGSLSGISFSGSFSPQVAASGSFSTGNPGSLTSYLGGTLNATIDPTTGTIAFGGGSSADPSLYNGKFPEVAAAPVPLTPQAGGGASGAPGSGPADYGISMKVTALSIFTAATGTGAVRNSAFDVTGAAVPLSGAPGNQTFVTNNNLALTITAGDFDYNLKGGTPLGITVPDIIGTTSLVGAPAAVTTGGVGTLTSTVVDPVRQIYNYMISIPVKSTINETITSGTTTINATITVTGTIAGYANNVQVPEPGSLALAGIAGVVGLIPLVRRYRSRSNA